jgi:hypothetical protein
MTTPLDFYPQYILDAVKTAAGDWRKAVVLVVNELVQHGTCFSSGEIARCLRIVDPTLAFKVTGIGEYVRDAFYTNQMGGYDINGTPAAPVQIGRTAQGLFPNRTPAGQLVFVYGPDQPACDAHPFEVYIPLPGEGLDQIKQTDQQGGTTAPTAPPQAAADSGSACVPSVPNPIIVPPPAKAVSLAGKAIKKDLLATVTDECRLYVSRDTFEQFVFLRGQPMRGGDPVYVRGDKDEVIITLDAQPGASQFTLEATRGRVKVPNGTGAPFKPGDKYRVTVTPNEIKVDLRQTV